MARVLREFERVDGLEEQRRIDFEARDFQEIGREVRYAFGVGLGGAHEELQVFDLALADAAVDQLEAGCQRGERRAQVVRDKRDPFVARFVADAEVFHDLGRPRAHAVQCARQHRDLVVAGLLKGTRQRFALHDRPRRLLGDALQSTDRHARRDPTEDAAQGRTDRKNRDAGHKQLARRPAVEPRGHLAGNRVEGLGDRLPNRSQHNRANEEAGRDAQGDAKADAPIVRRPWAQLAH